MNIDLKSFLCDSYDSYYEKGDYIYCFLLLRSMKNNYDFNSTSFTELTNLTSSKSVNLF